MDGCFICRKHAGLEPQPPGGYVWKAGDWWVCHAPAAMGPAGTLIVELARHALDYAALTEDEAAALGPLLRRVGAALKDVTGAERIYTLMTVEGAPHAHLWLVPRPAEATARGLIYLGQDLRCEEQEAAAMAERVRAALGEAG